MPNQKKYLGPKSFDTLNLADDNSRYLQKWLILPRADFRSMVIYSDRVLVRPPAFLSLSSDVKSSLLFSSFSGLSSWSDSSGGGVCTPESDVSSPELSDLHNLFCPLNRWGNINRDKVVLARMESNRVEFYCCSTGGFCYSISKVLSVDCG